MTSIVTAALAALAVLLGGNLPWAGFGHISGMGQLNLRFGTFLPWASPVMAVYLWAYWRFIDGTWGGGSPDSAAVRRTNLRAVPLPAPVWRASLVAGAAGFLTILAFLAVMARLVPLPSAAPIDTPPSMPAITAFLLLATQSVVAGVSEEAAFRGYMQSIIEREHGPAVAVFASGILFGLLHFGNHPADVLLMLPYYVVVSAAYGALTWAAGSILPAVVLHSAGDVIVLTRWWATGVPEWQLASSAPPLVGEHGIDASFIVSVLAVIGLTALTAALLARVRRLRTPGASTPLVTSSASATA